MGVTSNSVGGPRAGVGWQPGLQVLHLFELLLQVLDSRKIPTRVGFGKYAGDICTILSLVLLLILGGLYN